MKKMNKIIFASFIAVGITFSFQFDNLEAASRFDGGAWVEAPVTSGSISGYSRGCSVLAVYASSNTSAATNWFAVIATNPAENIVGPDSFASADYRSPAMFFPIVSSNTTITYSEIYKVLDYGEGGISFSTAPYIFKSAATSGQAQRVWLKIVP